MKGSMNKNDLAVSLMERHEMTRKEALALVDGIFEDIQNAVASSDVVKIPGFGIFKVRDRPARMARNPATGQPVKVAAKRVFKFTPAKALKEAVLSMRGGSKKKAAPAKKKAAPARKGAAKKSAAKRPAAKAPARKKVAKKATRRR